MGAQRTDLQRLDREFEVINRAGGRGEMPDVIDRAVEKQILRDILLDEFVVRVAGQVRDVVDRSRDKIINSNHAMAARQQQVGEVRAKKSRASRHDGSGLL